MPFLIHAPEQAGSTAISWAWPAPHHPRGKPFTYTLEMARLVEGKAPFAADTMVLTRTGIQATTLDLGQQSNGKYLVRIVAVDQDGHKTPAFNVYETTGDQYLQGVMCLSLPSRQECG